MSIAKMGAAWIRWYRVLTGLLLLFSLSHAGCSAGTTSHADGDDDHLEHHIPEHKPRDFADAVHQVRQRTRHIQDIAGDNDSGHLAHELRELGDIIAWLPELAADSDMRKQEWDRVHRLTQELGPVYESFAEQCSAGKPSAELVVEIISLTGQLGELVAFAAPGPQ
jgi:hypothetical protein